MRVGPGGGGGGDVLQEGAVEELGVVLGDEQCRAQGGGGQFGEGDAVEFDAPPVRVAAAGQAVQQGGGVGRVGDDEPEVFAGAHGQVEGVESGVAEAVQAQFAGGGDGGLRAAPGGLAGGGQHIGDAGGGGAALGQFGADPGQHADRSRQEEGEADGGDEGAEADRAAEDQTAADEGDERDERAGQREHQTGLEGGGAGGPHVGVAGGPAGGAVAGDGGALGAQALEHTDPGDQVGGHPGGVRGLFLFGLAAVFQRAGQEVAERHQHRGADKDEEAEGHGGAQQEHRARDDSDDGGDAQGQGHVDRPDAAGVLGGHVDQRAGRTARFRSSVRGEDPAQDVQAQSVGGLFGGALTGAGAETEAVGEEGVDDGEDHQPERQRSSVGADHGTVDDDPDQNGDEGLADLVAGPEEGAGDDVPALPGDGAAYDAPPGGAVGPHSPAPHRVTDGGEGDFRTATSSQTKARLTCIGRGGGHGPLTVIRSVRTVI